MADVANAILTTMEETNINVKIRAAWALGNLSDALVLNKWVPSLILRSFKFFLHVFGYILTKCYPIFIL